MRSIPHIGRAASALLLATPLANAFSLPAALVPRSEQLEKRATIPAAISIGPSQYWEGDGEQETAFGHVPTG